MTPYELEKQRNEKFKPISRKYTTGKIGFYQALEEAYNLDRESQPVMPKHAGNRFEIENSGRPFLAFETEAHIVDDQNPGCTIIVKSGYSTLEETNEYANKILKILNDGSL